MPKVVIDSELLAEVRALEQTVGSRAKLARILGVDRSTFWRFCKNGCGIDKTRETIRDGIIRYRNATNANTSELKAAMPITFTGSIHEDMRTLRSLCTTVLTVLDGYEKLLAETADNN